MKKLTVFLLLLTAAIGTSCYNAKDGDWDPIELTIDGKYIKKNTIDVPADGGTYVMSSRNYGVPWVLNIAIDGSNLWPEGYVMADFPENGITYDWLYYKHDTKNGHTIKLEPNLTSADRIVKFDLECGDAFATFTFIQKHTEE